MRNAWGTRWSHYWDGKLGSQEEIPAQRRFLNVRIARSAELRRWVYGGTSWKLTFLFAEGFLHGAGAFVVEDVESGSCAVLLEIFLASYPGVGDFQGLPFLQKVGVDGVGVVVVEDEYILVSAGREYREAAGLVRV